MRRMESSPEEATTNFIFHYVLGGGAGNVNQVSPENRALHGAPRMPLGVTRDLCSSLLYILHSSVKALKQ